MNETSEIMGAFPEDWPDGCPPADAMDASGEFFRVVKETPCVATDFRTQAELGKAKNGCPCQRLGLSVLTDFESAKNYMDKYPYLGNMIAFAQLSPDHGKKKHGHDGHATWWAYTSVERHALFSVLKPQ